MKYDLIIRECLVVDPANDLKKEVSVGIKDGKILEVGEFLDGSAAKQVVYFPGMVLMPGIVDSHVHASDLLGGELSFGMMARAGVTTALDMAGPVNVVMDYMNKAGAGINMAVLNALWPNVTIKNMDPTLDECRELVTKSLAGGAIGIKLIGGHYPYTADACRNAIKAANENRVYAAWHAGSEKNGSNINGVFDTVEFAEGRPFHLAHINAYCRGMVTGDAKDELNKVLKLLTENRQIISEFHCAPLNGANGKCIDGVPESHIVRNCLKMGGYEITEEGLIKAFKDGYAQASWENLDGANRYVQTEKALEYWRMMGGNCTCCFPVNNREVAFLCASSKDENGAFIIDALSTDGGGIPRNFILYHGYQLVEWGVWTVNEFVKKSSTIPAKMLGLVNKGHLSVGADADITVFDPIKREAVMTVVNGKINCLNGVLTNEDKGAVICTEKGKEAVKAAGLSPYVIDMEKSMLYAGR